jgi:hypothetical protein
MTVLVLVPVVPEIRVGGTPYPFFRKIQPRWISPPKRPRRICTDD